MNCTTRRKRIATEEVSDVTIVTFLDTKILDDQSIAMIGWDLFELVDDQKRTKLLLNFSNVEFMASYMLGKLLELYHKVQAEKGVLIICGIDPEIRYNFEVTRLDQLLRLVTMEEDALRELGVQRRA